MNLGDGSAADTSTLFERITELVDQQPPALRDVFHFVLSVAMEESDKAKLINTAQIEDGTWHSYEMAAGDVFPVVRPEIGAGSGKDILSEGLECRGARLW